MTGAKVWKGYVDGAAGQFHYRSCGSGSPPLICLAPAPFSGLAFANILPLLAGTRQAVAPDYPGYGGSDPLKGTPSIATYAAAMLDFAQTAFSSQPVDLLGFHSGCLVAVEMALQRRAAVGKMVLVDVPAFAAEARRDYRQRLSNSVTPHEDLESLAALWERTIVTRKPFQSFEQRIELFAEMVRSGEAINAMFEAAFDYDVEGRLPALDHPVTIIATDGSLAQPSYRAAKLLPQTTLIDRQDISGSVLDANAQETAHAILNALESP